jgi:hypothetical protein
VPANEQKQIMEALAALKLGKQWNPIKRRLLSW